MRMLTKVRRTMHKQSEDFSKDIENVRKYQAENIELKKRTEKFQRGILQQMRLSRKRSCRLEDRAVECIQSEEQKEKSMKKKITHLKTVSSMEEWKEFRLCIKESGMQILELCD